ncbi:MAG TPA: response regulator [Dermatophilaceae bacterium]|jgi:signal transduction histidine kinase
MTEPTKTRILVAEDDSDILELVVFLLTEAGFDTVAVDDGLAALAAIEADPPRLAILDIQMPGMSGIEVLRRIRASATIGDLEVILLSAHALDSDVDTGFAAGANDYVTKPFTSQELLQHVTALTEQNRALRQLQTRALSTHQTILEIGRAIRAASDTQQALDIMCAALGEGLGVDRVLANGFGIQHGVQLGSQWHRPGVGELRDLTVLPELGGLAEELWLVAGFRAEDDLLAVEAPLPELAGPFIQEVGARAGIAVPIGLGDRVIGIIYVIMVLEPRAWTTAEIGVVQAAAGFVARAIVAAEHQANQRDYVDRIEKLDRQKSDFLATVSHELRTPLTSISGYLELLQGQDAGKLTLQQQQRMLDAISRNTVRLRSLIEDVMVLSRIEGGVSESEYVEVSIREVIIRASKELSALAQGNAIQLKIDAGPQAVGVLGDRASLDRALVNILSNAIKFSRPEGVVSISATQDHDARRVLITCEDHGVGIPAGDLANLFTRFFRASNATDQAIPGTGLGLSIAKQIVEDHHGELRLSSVEGEGTTVVTDLPMYGRGS